MSAVDSDINKATTRRLIDAANSDDLEVFSRAVCRNVVTGTHLGEYMGIAPTGKAVTYDEIFIFRFVSGRIVETWGVVDVLAQMRQLGVLPASPLCGSD